MGNARVQENRFNKSNQPNPNKLKEPSNIDEVVGIGPSMITDYFATLGAVFKTAIYGPLNTWSGFWQNVENKAALAFKRGRIKLYNKIKGPHDKLQIAFKVRSLGEVERLKARNKNLQTFEIFKTSISEKDLQEIIAVLPKNYTGLDRMISLKKIAKDSKISREIRQLINQKLNEALKNPKFIKYIPEDPHFYRYQMLKRAVAAIGISSILALGLYYSNKTSYNAPLNEEPTTIETITVPSEDTSNLVTIVASSTHVTQTEHPIPVASSITTIQTEQQSIIPISSTTNTSIVRPSFWNFWTRRVIEMDKAFKDANDLDKKVNGKINELNQWLNTHIDNSIESFRASDQTRIFSNESRLSRYFFTDHFSGNIQSNWNEILNYIYGAWNFIDNFAAGIDQKSTSHLKQFEKLMHNLN